MCINLGIVIGTNGVELMIGENSLRLQAWGKFDSESAFLEILRKYDGRLLAIDFEMNVMAG